jgi:hypothetical protein
MRRALAVSSIVWGWSAGAWSGAALASGGAATDAYDGIAASDSVDVHGLLDVYAIHNFDRPASGINELRQFDFRDRASLEYLRFTLARLPSPIGFRLDAGAGTTADVFKDQDPAVARHPTYARMTSFVGQAFVTAVLPLARQVQVDVGKFGTPVGFEDNESLANWNYSRSLLYTWAEPTLHTGLRATSELSQTIAVSLFWVNGWNAGLVDGSGMRTVAAAATFKPADPIVLSVADMAGLEHPPTELTAPLSFRNILDATVVVEPWTGVSFAVTADLGNDRADGGVRWWGVSWYARVQTAGWLAGTLRGEVLADPDGFITGTRQSVAEATATGEVRGSIGGVRLVTRLELRHDQSNTYVFDAALPASRTQQDTVTLAFMSAF